MKKNRVPGYTPCQDCHVPVKDGSPFGLDLLNVLVLLDGFCFQFHMVDHLKLDETEHEYTQPHDEEEGEKVCPFLGFLLVIAFHLVIS